MSAVAIGLRAVFFLLILAIIVRKAWPGELLDTPLAGLTLGQLLLGTLQVFVGVGIGSVVVAMMLSVPSRDKRDSEWTYQWVGTIIGLGVIVAFPFVYGGMPRHNSALDALSFWVATAIGWLIT